MSDITLEGRLSFTDMKGVRKESLPKEFNPDLEKDVIIYTLRFNTKEYHNITKFQGTGRVMFKAKNMKKPSEVRMNGVNVPIYLSGGCIKQEDMSFDHTYIIAVRYRNKSPINPAYISDAIVTIRT